jgi:hypothetical protein
MTKQTNKRNEFFNSQMNYNSEKLCSKDQTNHAKETYIKESFSISSARSLFWVWLWLFWVWLWLWLWLFGVWLWLFWVWLWLLRSVEATFLFDEKPPRIFKKGTFVIWVFLFCYILKRMIVSTLFLFLGKLRLFIIKPFACVWTIKTNLSSQIEDEVICVLPFLLLRENW